MIVTLISLILTVIGAINWLLVGLFDFNLVNWITGDIAVIARIIYALVGIAGIWMIGFLIRKRFKPSSIDCPTCDK